MHGSCANVYSLKGLKKAHSERDSSVNNTDPSTKWFTCVIQRLRCRGRRLGPARIQRIVGRGRTQGWFGIIYMSNAFIKQESYPPTVHFINCSQLNNLRK